VATTFARRSYRNRVLASLPADLIEQLAPHLTPVDLPVNRALNDAGDEWIPCTFWRMVFARWS